MITHLSLLVAVLGALVYGLSANAKVAELGRISYAVGLLVYLAGLASHLIKLP